MSVQIILKSEGMDGSAGEEDLSDYGDCEDTAGEEELMSVALHNSEITAQLAAAGPAGLAAAAAIVSTKKRKRPHVFETNPSIRKRQHNRLLRKLSHTIDELATRVGQQAVVVVATPGKANGNFKCFGAKPLEDVIKNLRSAILTELEAALSEQAPAPAQEDPSLYELPPLVIDGIPTPVEKMTQAQLRAFIPLMLKFSTGNGKPGWGRESTKPPWWPKDLPWANVRMDARSCDEKQKTSWTHALRQIVINCYKYHGREDLLPAFNDSSTEDTDHHHEVKRIKMSPQNGSPLHHQVQAHHLVDHNSEMVPTAVLQTITNPDGTVSIIHVDPSNPIITLPDGTTAHVQGVATIHAGEDTSGDTETVTVDLNSVTEDHEGQIILQSEDGTGYPVSVSGMITVPGSMYQTVVANIQAQGDGTIQVVTPAMMGVPGDVEVDRSKTHQIVVSTGDGPQVLQVVSLKDSSQKGID